MCIIRSHLTPNAAWHGMKWQHDDSMTWHEIFMSSGDESSWCSNVRVQLWNASVQDWLTLDDQHQVHWTSCCCSHTHHILKLADWCPLSHKHLTNNYDHKIYTDCCWMTRQARLMIKWSPGDRQNQSKHEQHATLLLRQFDDQQEATMSRSIVSKEPCTW